MYKRIRNLREDKDLNQKQMAELLSVAQTTYSDYELGKLNIPIPILIQLAQFFQTSIDYLLELTDDPRPYPRKRDK
ncbi:MAG: helix-turn-helix domain-containing protein [Candidatus Merdivicinus sp.]